MQSSFFIRLLLLFVSLLIGSSWQAQADDNELWKRANSLYLLEQYDSAQQIYLQLLDQYDDQAQLYYNLGNTAYRLQQTDSAILFYEKSLLLNPRDEATKENLAIVQSRIVNPLPQAPVFFFTKWWNQLLTVFSANTWAWMGFSIFLLILVLIYFNKIKSTGLPYVGRWLSLSIVCLLLLLCLSYFSYSYAVDSGRAVVMGQHKELLDGPSGKAVTEVPRGTVVMLISKEDGYFRLRLPNGNEGWMPETALAKI